VFCSYVFPPANENSLGRCGVIGESVTHYKILSKLGEGGMGVVYKAQDLKLDRLAALKFLPLEFTRDPEARDRFIHEAKAASSLQHSNICVIYEVDETDDGHLFISMEYLESETLESTIARGPLTINQALDIAIQVAQGMAEAHCHGIVHRDLKPANVLLTNRGEAKIVDFGVAKFARAGNLTRQGMTVGTVAYMSPEQARGDHVDERTDIWSLGVLLYEMLTGRRPFIGEYEHAVSYSIANVDPEPLTALRGGISPDLERIIRKCLAKHPGARYQRMEALRADLLSCRSPFPINTPAGEEKACPSRRRRPDSPDVDSRRSLYPC
jgi:serine/threonine-protein kinase